VPRGTQSPKTQSIAGATPSKPGSSNAKQQEATVSPTISGAWGAFSKASAGSGGNRAKKWSRLEDEKLKGLHFRDGTKWKKIQRHFERRNSSQLRNRWGTLSAAREYKDLMAEGEAMACSCERRVPNGQILPSAKSTE
jgi:hypothetical protein